MKRQLVGLLVVFAACGDNNNTDGDTCGPGTMLQGTACVPVCADGTIVDPVTNACTIDPTSCQDGTVLINNKCQDPTAGLTIDLEEGAEPNGLGVGFEVSTQPAGVITLKPVGDPDGFVIHGHITPFQDVGDVNNPLSGGPDGQTDPDYDTYTLTVPNPTLLDISADGIGGLTAAFLVSGRDLTLYRRFGLNVTGSTSKRQIFLPAPGTYNVTIGDTRSMFVDGNSPPAAGGGAAAGGPNAEYYISINQLAMPTPTALPVTGVFANTTGTLGSDDIKFFTAPMGLGFNDIQLTMHRPAAGFSSEVNGSVVVLNNGGFQRITDEFFDDGTGKFQPADVTLAGVNPSDTTLIVADFDWNYGPDPATFALNITQGIATALPIDGSTTAPVVENASVPCDPVTGACPITNFNVFFYQVGAANEIDGLNIAWNHPVDGHIIDANFVPFAEFSFDPMVGFVGNTWQSYAGLLRHKEPGRYYFVVYDPAGTPGTTTLTATSTFTSFVTPTAITLGTPTATQTNNAFNATPFTFDAGTTVPWQQYAATGTGTGVVTAEFIDPATAFGRLDPLTLDETATGAGPGIQAPNDVTPFFTEALAASGAPKGRILLDDAITSYIVEIKTATGAASATYDLAFDPRKSPVAKVPFGSFPTITATPTVLSPNALASGDRDFFLVRTTAGGLAKLLATPTGTKPDIELTSLNADESSDVTEQTVGTGAETGTFVAHTGGWVAVQVTGASAGVAGTFDISAATATTGTYAAPPTRPVVAFVSICTGGTNDVTMHADNSFNAVANDEGLSDALAVPSGLAFFGASVGSLQISTNGWLSFQTDQVNAQGFAGATTHVNVTMPTAGIPNALIAPYWTDLFNVEVCAKTVGTTMTIEWQATDGIDFTHVATQVQLDATTGVITFVYAATQVPTGQDATIGIEDFAGVTASLFGFDSAGKIAPSTAVRFTPN